jgi:hypothetical protein
LGDLVLVVAVLAAGSASLVVTIRKKRHKEKKFVMFWVAAVAGVLVLGGIGAGNVICQYMQCKEWLKTGNYKVVEGIVKNFHPMPWTGHDSERFSVNGVRFEYSDFDLSKGGFNNTSSHGGPIKENLPVRIAYKSGRILRLEVGVNQTTQQGASVDANSATRHSRQ